MTGIQALRGLPKDLRAKVIACIIKSPLQRSKNMHKYLSSDISEEAFQLGGSRYKNLPSVLFSLGFNWSDCDYVFWRDKFKELEGFYW